MLIFITIIIKMNEIKAIELYENMPYIRKGILGKGQKVLVKVAETSIFQAEVKERTAEQFKMMGLNYKENKLYLSIESYGLMLMDINPVKNWIVVY